MCETWVSYVENISSLQLKDTLSPSLLSVTSEALRHSNGKAREVFNFTLFRVKSFMETLKNKPLLPS